MFPEVETAHDENMNTSERVEGPPASILANALYLKFCGQTYFHLHAVVKIISVEECVAQMYLNRTLIQHMHIQAIIYPIYCMRIDSDYIYATHSEMEVI